MPRPYHVDRYHGPRLDLRLREAAFVLQQSVPQVERTADILNHPDGTPGLRFVGSIRVVDVRCLEHFLLKRGEVRASAAGGLSRLDALDLITRRRATAPTFASRNGAPPPLSAIVMAQVERDQS